MRAFNGATEILGDANSLDLDAIRIKCGGLPVGFGLDFTTFGYQDLSIRMEQALFLYGS